MALTNFAALTPEQKTAWARDLWRYARENTFMNRFVGSGNSAIIQRISELSKTEKGEIAIMHLLQDLEDDGVTGDNQREGNEEALQTSTDTITIDMIAHSVRNKGRFADQKTIVEFRNNAREQLAYWLASRLDDLFILTMSGIGYDRNTDGSLRTSSAFSQLAFAADVSAPTDQRHVRLDGAGGLAAGNTAAVTATDLWSYNSIVTLHTYAKNQYIRPIMSGGKDHFVLICRPEVVAQLKRDPDFIRSLQNGMARGDENPIFKGGMVTADGLVIHETRRSFNTLGLTSGTDKWGAGNDVDGSRALLVGSQACGFADLEAPQWNEKDFDYGNSQGINVSKMFGFLKPKYFNQRTGDIQDFGVIAVDHAITPDVI